MAGGRPTDYNPDFCERVIELGKQGKSVTQIACALDVVKSTLYLWEQEHPEFSDAMKKARQHAQTWFEEIGQNALFADKFQASLWNKQVTCRFPEDYRDTVRNEHAGPNGGAIRHQHHQLSEADADILKAWREGK
jgi:transposase-like protein